MMESALDNGRIALVTGGSGFVGGHLIKRLLADGWRVRGLARSPESEARVRSLGATPVPGDLNDATALERAMAGCEVVFHVAAHFKLWGRRAVFDRMNVDGTRAVVAAARASKDVRRVVAVSAAAVVMGDPIAMVDVDETAPRQDRAFAPYSSSKAEGERVLLDANGSRPGLETVAIRPPFIWGDNMPSLDEMVKTVHAGRWQWVDGGKPFTISTAKAITELGYAPRMTMKDGLAGMSGKGVEFGALPPATSRVSPAAS